MLVDLFQSENFRMFMVLAFFAAGATYVMRRPARAMPAAKPVPDSDKDGPMASKIAALTTENIKLRGEVERLEYTVDKVLEENRRLRERVDALTVQVNELTSKMQTAQRNAEEWQQTAHDWQTANRAQKEP